MKLDTLQIGKRAIEIEITPAGKFIAVLEDMDFKADTKAELIEQLKKAVKRADRVKPIAVTVVGLVPKRGRKSWDHEHFENGAGAVDAVLRGYHQRNRVWLLTSVDGGHKFNVGGWSSEGTVIVRRLTLAETLEYTKKLEAMRVAKTALEDFIGAAKVDPAKLLEKGDSDGE